MLRLAHPDWLYALLPLGLLALAVLWQWGRLLRRRARLADAEALDRLTGQSSPAGRRARWLLGLLGLACFAVAMANPQFGTRERIAEVRATDLVLALDISESMLTEDVRPSRLQRARSFLLDVLAGLDGERVALQLFAADAYLQAPLTVDYAAVALMVRAAAPAQAATQGTSLAAPLELARELLNPPLTEGEAPPAPRRRIVVLVSDGEDHEPRAAEAAELAAEEGQRVFAVGVGTPEGGRVPADGGGPFAFKRGPDGDVVVSRFDGEALRALAEAGGGRYYDLGANPVGAAASIVRAVQEGPTADSGEEVFREAASYFQLFVALGLLCWAAAWWVGLAAKPVLTPLRGTPAHAAAS